MSRRNGISGHPISGQIPDQLLEWRRLLHQFSRKTLLMPKFSVEVPHEVERSEAAVRLRTFSDRVRADLPGEVKEIQETWDEAGNLDFAFRAMGFTVSGRMENRPGSVHVAGTIPFAALPFRGAIERQIAEKVREAIA